MTHHPRHLNTIVVSAHLSARYPRAFAEIVEGCRLADLQLRVIDTRNIWPRDFLPLQVGARWVKFAFHGYGGDVPTLRNYPWLRVGPKAWSFLRGPIQRSGIALDGGNVQRLGHRAVLTEIVFRHNPEIPRTRLVRRLEKLLDAEIILVPVEPGDDIGHTDGTLQWIPDAAKPTVLLNDYGRHGSKGYQRYAERVQAALSQAGIAWHLFPYAYHKAPHITEHQFRRQFPMGDSFNPGFGYYVNFLVAGRLVLLPRFGIEDDAEAVACVKSHFPGYVIRTVDCARLSMEGGLVNCATMPYTL